MDDFSNVDQPFASAAVTAPAHVCEKLLKLHGTDFHDNLLIIEMSKSPLEQIKPLFSTSITVPQSSRLYIAMEMQ